MPLASFVFIPLTVSKLCFGWLPMSQAASTRQIAGVGVFSSFTSISGVTYAS